MTKRKGRTSIPFKGTDLTKHGLIREDADGGWVLLASDDGIVL
jgi:hypothetical protein